jgi:hypothetical protein
MSMASSVQGWAQFDGLYVSADKNFANTPL